MKYKVGDYVRVSYFGEITEVDDNDQFYPYRVGEKDSNGYWYGERHLEDIEKAAFFIDQVINDGFGKTGAVKDINYVPRRKTYQYKVNGEWIDEAALVEVNK